MNDGLPITMINPSTYIPGMDMLQPVKHNFIASVSLRCVSPWLDEGVPEAGVSGSLRFKEV